MIMIHNSQCTVFFSLVLTDFYFNQDFKIRIPSVMCIGSMNNIITHKINKAIFS